MRVEDIIVDALTFPVATGQEETRRDGIETIEAIRQITTKYPGINTTLGVSNVSFGLNPAARVVLNSVFLHEAVQAGLSSGIIDAAKIVPLASLPEEQRKVALDLVYDRREYDADGNVTYDPLAIMLDLFAGVDTAALKDQRAAELAALPTGERLQRRIIDGEGKGLEADLDLARSEGMSPLAIINDQLLEGMKVVGERFGAGEMQLPFVLQSAEVMKNAVALLEPHMEKSDASGKGTMVIATVRGDVHDIGKNLVDIILTNNGYKVVNIGIKQGIAEIMAAAEEHDADVIGMSGLLVKSTVVMKENLAELQSRGLAKKWPIILGGAALTRAYVEQDLAEQFEGTVRYAKDAFEGLALMEPLVQVARGADPDAVGLPPLKKRIHKGGPKFTVTEPEAMPGRSDVAADNPVPAPPFWGTRIVRGVALHDYAALLDERATFMGQWGLKPGRGDDGASYEELVELEGRPRLRYWLDRILAEECSTRPSRTAISRWSPKGNRWWCCTTGRITTACSAPRACSPPMAVQAVRSAPSGCVSTSRASAGTGTCASPTSSVRANRGRWTSCPCSWSPPVRRSTRSRPSCSRATTTATTTSSTAWSCSSPRHWRNSGMRASAPSWASRPRSPRTRQGTSSSITAVRGSRSATPRALTWRTAAR